MKRRILSICIILCMLLALLPLSAVAAGEACELNYSLSSTADLKAGETVTVTVSLSNCSDNLSSYDVRLNYDKDLFTIGTIDVSSRPTGEGMSTDNNNATDGYYHANRAYSSDVSSVSDCNLLIAEFAANEDIHGTADFSISNVSFSFNNGLDSVMPTGNHDSTLSVNVYEHVASSIPVSITAPVKYTAPQATVADGTGYTGSNITWNPAVSDNKFAPGQGYAATATLTTAAGYKFNTNQTVTVTGASITYGTRADTSVTFTATFPATAAANLTSITVTPESPASMVVPNAGSTAATQQFTAVGYDGGESYDISGSSTWSIVSPETHSGISISSSGLLSVDNTAASNAFTGNSMTVTIQSASGGVSDTQDVTITREDSAVTSITVSGGQENILVPADGDGDIDSTTFAATVYDQYGQTMSEAPVTWTVTTDGTTTVGGVTITGGIVTVTNSAKSTITNMTGVEMTVTATSGASSGTSNITVKRAASSVTSVTVGDGAADILVPADGVGDNTSAAFTATVNDQYGSEMSGQTVTWTVTTDGTTTVDGVTISGGVITVANSAKSTITDTTGIEMTVTAQVGSETDMATITIKRDTPAYDKVEITRGSSAALTDDLLVIPQSGNTDYTYIATVYDQYGSVITDNSGAWSGTIGDVNGVTRSDNVVSVSFTASENDTGTIIYTEGVSGSSNAATVNISLSTLEVDWSGVAVSSPSQTYGATNESFVTLPVSGTATDGATTVNGTFSVVDPSAMPDVADTTVTVRFTVTTAGDYENVTFDKDYIITVTPRTLTVTPNVGQSKAYGASEPTLTYAAAGAVSGQTPDFSGVLSRDAGDAVGTYNITAGDLALSDNGNFKANNYQISVVTSVTFAITPATITITSAEPGHTVLANATENTSTSALKAIADSGSALPNTVDISYSGTTGAINIIWAEVSQTWDVKGGTYTYVGTVASDANYANRPTLTATVTVTPVMVTAVKQDASTDLSTTITVAKADVLSASTLAEIGVPATGYLTFDNSVTAVSGQTIIWDKTLANVKTVANGVTETSGDQTITLTIQPGTYPNWATAPVTAATFTVTITNKYPVNLTFTTPVDDITYGQTLATPVAEQQAISNGTDTSGSASFTYSYVGTGSTAYGPSDTPPSDAGTYKVVATLVSDTHSGTGEDTFTINKKPLADSMITGITPDTNTYTGSAIKPIPTVEDVSGPITADDYMISWQDNINAGSSAKVVITAASNGNYSGSAEYTFTIDKAELSATPEPTIVGIAAVGNVLTASQYYHESEITYQWTRGGLDIAGATNRTYTLTSADSNQSIGVKITGAGVNYLSSSTITAADVTIAKQAISGVVEITGGSSPVTNADTLTADITGLLPAEAQSSATYQWTATYDGTTSNLGTAQSQALTGQEADTIITVTVTPNTDFAGTLSASVTIGKTPLASTFAISGSNLPVGDTITPTGQVNGAALADDSDDYDLQWMRNGEDVSGANGTTYTVTDGDLGATITLKAMGKGNYTGTVLATGSAAVAALKPDAPVITATAGNGQVTISWTAPDDNGSPITGYVFYHKQGTGIYDSGVTIPANKTSVSMSSLNNGTTYTFKVTAENAVGTSDASNEATATPFAAGGGVGGGGSNDTKQEGITISGPGGSANVEVQVEGSSAKITADNEALNKLFEGSGSGVISLDISSADEDVSKVTFDNNFVTAMKNAVENGNTTGMSLNLPGGNTIELDKNVLQSICDAAGNGELNIGITPVSTNSLPSAMQGALEGQDVGAVFEISITSGGTEISELGGTAKITFAVAVSNDVKSVRVYKVYPDGTTELVQSSLDLVNGEVIIERQNLSTYAIVFSDTEEWINPYGDVQEDDWFYHDVEFVSVNELMNGITNTTFSPEGTTTRAMVATVLWRLEGEPAATAANPFADVASGKWYSTAIAWAAENGIVNGMGDDLFGTDQAVTREQFVTMLFRYAEFKGNDLSAVSVAAIEAFADYSEINDYAVLAMAWAYDEGIINGRTSTTLVPCGSAQRAELAAMLHRFAKSD